MTQIETVCGCKDTTDMGYLSAELAMNCTPGVHGSLAILTGDCFAKLRTLPDESVHCCVTSPPYWGLRDYGVAGQLGLEKTPEEYVAKMVAVFREVRRTLRPDAVLFLNLGDSYSSLTLGVLRGDLTDEECKSGLQIVWETLGQKEREGILSSLLPKALEEEESREGAGVVSAILPTEQGGVSPQDKNGSQESQAENDSGFGREMCMLRGDGNDVPLPGSYQGERKAGLCEEGGAAWGVEARHSRGASAGQIPDSLLELQLSFGLIRLLSAREIDLAGLPSKARRYFKVTLKPKDEVDIPGRVCAALCRDGWYRRQTIIWAKPNPIPESVTDRCTKAHEYIFLLTKSARYWYDAEAVAETVVAGFNGSSFTHGKTALDGERKGLGAGPRNDGPTRNKRSVWTVATAPYSEAHFATFPPDLIKPCVLAGCPVKVCAKCGAGWERVVEREGETNRQRADREGFSAKNPGAQGINCAGGHGNGSSRITKDLGFRPGCDCDAGHGPGTVLDPFGGSGTTGMVALELGRRAILIELNPEYVELIRQRTDVTMGLAI